MCEAACIQLIIIFIIEKSVIFLHYLFYCFVYKISENTKNSCLPQTKTMDSDCLCYWNNGPKHKDIEFIIIHDKENHQIRESWNQKMVEKKIHFLSLN